jgi:hypothetical protein
MLGPDHVRLNRAVWPKINKHQYEWRASRGTIYTGKLASRLMDDE